MSGRLERALKRASRQKRAALVPFLTAGFPSPGHTVPLLQALERGGADLVELGVAFSDPVADGPTIQRSSEQALAHGTSLEQVLGMVRDFRRTSELPVILFTYFNPVHALGLARFASEAAAAGVDAALLVDVPVEEAAEPMGRLSRVGVSLVPLLAPTSTLERIRAVRRCRPELVYLVARTGVTGSRRSLEEGLEARTRLVRDVTRSPVAVGFGISTEAQVHRVAAFADAVVVGSALVERIDAAANSAGLGTAVTEFVHTLAAATRR